MTPDIVMHTWIILIKIEENLIIRQVEKSGYYVRSLAVSFHGCPDQ